MRLSVSYILPGLVASLLLAFTACGDDDEIQFGESTSSDSESYTVSTDISTRMEIPEYMTDGSTTVVMHTTTESGKTVVTYTLEYSHVMMHSRWVAFRFDGDTRAKTVSRASNDAFMDDPDLSSDLAIGSNGFGTGYDRGHLCASADRLYSTDANEQTFYMSNMSPQISNFNQYYWVTLEGQVQTLGRNTSFSDTLYVVKGGTILEDQINGYITRSNGKQVAIPTYYFMALLKIKNNVYSSIAFLMEHKNYGSETATLDQIEEHALTVNDLEDFTGINFFPNLDDSQEESIESQLLPSNWGF